MTTKFGYARVSTDSQSYESQRVQLEAAGCTIVRAEKVSGKSREGRDELTNLLDFIRPGDQLVVQRIDRLGRQLSDILAICNELKSKGAVLTVLEPSITTGDDLTGRLMVTVLGMAADLERTFLLDRQREGIERRKAMDKGLPADQRAYRGRRRTVDHVAILELRKGGMRPTAIAQKLGISRMSVYRAVGGA